MELDNSKERKTIRFIVIGRVSVIWLKLMFFYSIFIWTEEAIEQSRQKLIYSREISYFSDAGSVLNAPHNNDN